MVKTGMNELEEGGWINWAIRNGIEPEIIAYLMFHQGDFFQFSSEMPYPTPRSWTFADQWLKLYKQGKINWVELRKLLAGCIGPQVAEKFSSFILLSDLTVHVEWKEKGIVGNVKIFSNNPQEFGRCLVVLIINGYRPDLVQLFKPYEEGFVKKLETGEEVVFRESEIIYYTLITTLEVLTHQYYEWLLNQGFSEDEAKKIICRKLSSLFAWIENEYRKFEKEGEISAEFAVKAIEQIILERYTKMFECEM